METVKLRSRGPVSFRDTVRTVLPSGNATYDRKEFRFDFDNGFQQEIPREIWERIEFQDLDRTAGLKYRDYIKPI